MHSITRRQFAQTAAGTAALGATATVSAQESPDYGGWFDDVSNFDGTVDRRGQDTVEITVGAQGNNGAFAFGPAAVLVNPGTEVVWTWSGKEGATTSNRPMAARWTLARSPRRQTPPTATPSRPRGPTGTSVRHTKGSG
ncbi:hypothetical protein ACFQL1_17470 [Halomicroarcula sp. GCM10025709]|uniref:hypothetical protein n=1 Tax=Halomicroarcula sp. GCM10025709 TaxID=3252669 RepID=UPI0036108E2E